VKVLIPDMPSAGELQPYLRRIDASLWYSNGGPLVLELEKRTGGVAVSSATLGLELAAKCIFRKRVRIPAFTFPATATALIRAGLEPVLCDVDENLVLVDIDEDSLPVCPFGAPVRPGGLVDAAAAWGAQHEGNRVFSLHATKSLPAGEGGLVCGDKDLLARIRKLSNFGMVNGVVHEVGTNAKLSEYHAAVALASLDRWDVTLAKRLQVRAWYVERLGETFPSITNFPVLVQRAADVSGLMGFKGIETRRWYVPTLERHPAFVHLKREGNLANSRRLNEELLCLPFHTRLSERDVDRICEVFRWATTKTGAARASTGWRTSPATSRSASEHVSTPS